MSRFFENLTNETNEIKRKTEAVARKENEGFEPKKETSLSKAEKKIAELFQKVENVKNGKSFEKSAKKLVGELKKYLTYIKTAGVPDFLIELFSDKRFKSNKVLKKESEDFLELLEEFSANETKKEVLKEEVNKKSNEDAKKKTIEDILGIKSISKREEALEKLKPEDLSDEDAFVVTVALFTIVASHKDTEKMINILRKYITSGRVSNKIYKNMNGYLENIELEITEKEYEIYANLLDELIGNGWVEGVKKRLEFQFLHLNNAIETTIEPFNILYMLRSDNWEGAYQCFKKEEERLEKENVYTSFEGVTFYSKAWEQVLIEYGETAARYQKFEEAFRVLSRLKPANGKSKVLLYALCVVLLTSVKDSDVFSDFLEDFKTFDANKLLLESEDSFDEIFRAFFLLHKKDCKRVAEILKKEANIDAADRITETIQSIV